MSKPVLDTAALDRGTVTLQLVLFLSAAIGVTLGLGLVVAVAFVTAFLIPGGVFATLAAILTTSVYATHLAIMGVAAILLIPLAALVVAHLKLRMTADYIVRRSGAKVLPHSNRAGSALAAMASLAGLSETPRYGVLSNTANAFALSADRETALILIGEPLREVLTARDIMAIIAHEMGHVAMGDTRRKLLAIGHQEFLVAFLGFAGLKRFARNVFGLVGELALAAHSREREYWADAVGAHVTSVEDMTSALRKMAALEPAGSKLEKRFDAIMLRPASAWFSSHPSFEQRIAALESGAYLHRLPTVAEVTDALEAAAEPAAPTMYYGI